MVVASRPLHPPTALHLSCTCLPFPSVCPVLSCPISALPCTAPLFLVHHRGVRLSETRQTRRHGTTHVFQVGGAERRQARPVLPLHQGAHRCPREGPYAHCMHCMHCMSVCIVCPWARRKKSIRFFPLRQLRFNCGTLCLYLFLHVYLFSGVGGALNDLGPSCCLYLCASHHTSHHITSHRDLRSGRWTEMKLISTGLVAPTHQHTHLFDCFCFVLLFPSFVCLLLADSFPLSLDKCTHVCIP